MQRLTSRPDVDAEHRRVALFGGCYNNWLATEALVADAKRRGGDGIWFLGDAGGFGPHPDRTVEALRGGAAGGVVVRSVQGNYDASVGNSRDDCACGYTDPRDNRFAQLSYDYTLAHTSPEHRRWLASLPGSARIAVGRHVVHLCHGSPRKVNEFLWQSTTPATFVEHLCRQWEADAIACTHTGLQWSRWSAEGYGIINVGAIGRPANDGNTHVWYAILEERDGKLVETFVPLAYDWQALAAEMRAEGLPPEFVETIETGWWTTCLEILPARERAAGRF